MRAARVAAAFAVGFLYIGAAPSFAAGLAPLALP